MKMSPEVFEIFEGNRQGFSVEYKKERSKSPTGI